MPDEVIVKRIADLAANLGTPLTPWQIQLLHHLYAVGPDGQFRYRGMLTQRRRK